MMSPTTINFIGTNHHLFITSLNIKGLNFPIKWYNLRDYLSNQDPAVCYIQETHLSNKDEHYLRVKGYQRFFQANSLKKQAGFAILISNYLG
jgi:exonuclease III